MVSEKRQKGEGKGSLLACLPGDSLPRPGCGSRYNGREVWGEFPYSVLKSPWSTIIQL